MTVPGNTAVSIIINQLKGTEERFSRYLQISVLITYESIVFYIPISYRMIINYYKLLVFMIKLSPLPGKYKLLVFLYRNI